MFDVGFWELAMILVVALLVVGPEKLPRLARTLGHWVGRGRRFVRTVKADINRELAAEDLKKAMEKQAGVPELHDIMEETDQAIRKVSRPGPAAQPGTDAPTARKHEHEG